MKLGPNTGEKTIINVNSLLVTMTLFWTIIFVDQLVSVARGHGWYYVLGAAASAVFLRNSARKWLAARKYNIEIDVTDKTVKYDQ